MIDYSSDLIPPSARNCDPVLIDLMIPESIDDGVITPNFDGSYDTVNPAAGKSLIWGLRSVENKD